MTVEALQLVPPGSGRRYTGRAVVRLSDAMPGGVARLDAIGRYLQDVAADDGKDSGINLETAWVVRKTIVELHRRPRLDEPLDLVTWASGSGARWAARRTTMAVSRSRSSTRSRCGCASI
jgi:acyl-ACP thioesterase